MRSVLSVNIAAAGTLSSSVDCGLEGSAAAVQLPAGWTTADIQLYGSMDNVNFYPMLDSSGSNVGATGTTASNMYSFSVVDALPAQYIKLKSSVAQTNAVTVNVIARKFV